VTDDAERRVVNLSSDTISRDIETSLDTVFRVLANQTRRFALYALHDVPDGVLDLETLIEEVVTLTASLDIHAFTQERYVDIASDLYYWHLPVLADVGAIDYDTRHDTIRYLTPPSLEEWVARVRAAELDG